MSQDGFVINSEKQFKTKSGEVREGLINVNRLLVHGDDFVITTIQDITERKHAETALQLSEEKFRTLADSIQDIFFAFDQDLRYTYWNKASEALTGIPSEKAIGRSLLEVFSDSPDTRIAEKIYREVLTTGISQTSLTEFTLQGVTSFFEVSIYPFAGGISVFTKDVTTQIRMQRELEQSHAQLQNLSRQLIETQENKRRTIGRELHDEIGQSLTGLRILLQMAQRPPLEEHQDKIEKARQVAGELIDRVSSISLDLRPPMLDDLGLLPALLWFMDRYTSRTGIHVDFLHTNLQDQRFASVIETAVYRLVQEALTNVARHANVSKAKVRVDAGSSSIAISIEDEGQGFDVQAAFDRNNRGGVSGICERVRLLDGELDIHSVPGQGTNISIHLPLKQKG